VILAVLSAALALVSLDNTIVNVALPRLQEDLGATTGQLQWIVDAYSVVFAGSLLLAGAIGDRWGRRLTLVIGLTVFILASTAAIFASGAESLMACRALMGLGGAFIMPSTLSILVQEFPEPQRRAQAIGIWAAVAGVGVAVGPVLGGFLLEHFSWHSVFWVNPPIALVMLALTLVLVPESRDATRPRVDFLGAALSGFGLVALVVTIIELPDSGISTVTITSAMSAALLLGAFIWWENRVPRPLIPMGLFREKLFSVSVVIVALVYFALMAAMFFLPQFLQLVQHLTPLQSGLAVVPGAGGLLIASVFSPRVALAIGTRTTVVAGLCIVTVGMLTFSTLTASTHIAWVSGTFFIIGLGLGFTLPQATNGVLATVPPERAGMGSAVNDAMGELGGAFGVAILGAAMSITYRANIEGAISRAGDAANILPAGALDAARESLAAASIAAGQLPADIGAVFAQLTGEAFVSGMNWALFIAAGITALGALAAFFLFPSRVDHVSE
jgi:EmrB/QacA subfamily drug resistance transporter